MARCLSRAALVVLLTTVFSAMPAAQTARILRWPDALALYAHGDAAVVHAIALADPGVVLRDFQRIGGHWIDDGRTSPEKDRRRLVLAAVTLEVLQHQYARSPEISRRLIEWACDHLRDTKHPLAAERLWFLGTIRLMESGGDTHSLEAHLLHARQRFKDEPEWELAGAWWDEMDAEAAEADLPGKAASRFADSRVAFGPSYAASGGPGGFIAESLIQILRPDDWRFVPLAGLVAPVEPRPNLWTTPGIVRDPRDVPGSVRRRYEQATAVPALSAEAHLRLGYIYFATGQPGPAREHFAQAEALSKAPDVRYLADLFIGWNDERSRRLSDAENDFRRALDAVPRSDTATLFLAAVLEEDGHAQAAEAALDESLASPATALDPWRTFGTGDLRPVTEYLAPLRDALR